jgi:hypothetical protein
MEHTSIIEAAAVNRTLQDWHVYQNGIAVCSTKCTALAGRRLEDWKRIHQIG